MKQSIYLKFLVLTASLALFACNSKPPGGHSVAVGSPAPTINAVASVGTVIDAQTNRPIKGAIVTIDSSEVTLTNIDGAFAIKPSVNKIAARACGYSREEMGIASSPSQAAVEIKLQPIRPKALYLTVYGIGSRVIRDSALKLIDETDLNALVIDVKGDRGFIPYKSAIPLAHAIGAQKVITVKDMQGLVQSLKVKGIYTIARIVVFKDNLLGSARPDLAIKTADGKIWLDREGLIWVDPSKKEVWEYAINIAVEAAQLGFDEIQFDYVRFPDHKGLKFGVTNTEEHRVNTIAGFLAEARKRLIPYNVFLAADIFGYVAWNVNDTQIGQDIDHLAPAVDYISLMLYPSGFHWGIPGYRNPVANPNKIVYLSLKQAQERTGLSSLQFRPWLQAFRDYAFDRRHFTGIEIREQIRAANDFGSDGWMFWNPKNIYSLEGFQKKISN
jgi:hypothetical protein